MLVTFSTDNYPNIIMFGEDAIALLKMMGHSGTVPGSIRAEEVPLALDSLSAAIKTGIALPSANTGDKDESPVSTAHRGKPLLELLATAAKANHFVMWK